MKCKLVGGDEVDAIEGKRFYRFRAGMRKRVKRKINKRLRRIARYVEVETGV